MFPAVRTMLLISHSSRLTRFHLHWLNFFHKLLCLSPSRILTSFILKKFVYWRKSEVKVSWGVYEFYELFDATFFYGFMSFGEIATWVFLDWKGRALSKRGVVYGTSVFRTESVDGKQRKGFYVVSYSDEPCIEMVIFLYVPSVLVWKRFVIDGEGGGGEIRTCTTCCLRDTKAMENVKQSSTNQNSCKCLWEDLTI